MIDTVCLNENFSTTKLLTQKESDNTNLYLSENLDRKGEGGLRTQGYLKKSYSEKPLISIVTVVYNGEKYLRDTIESVIMQDYDNVEYIIIDGGSNDKTLDIIKKYDDIIDYWVSEQDNGMYNALNKGFSIARGDILAFINADDLYAKNVFSSISKSFIEDVHLDLTIGDVIFQYSNGLELEYKTRRLPIRMAQSLPRMFFAQPSTFFSTRIYKALNGFNETYRLSADFDFYSRLFNKTDKYVHINKVFSKFKFIKYSNSAKYIQLSNSENEIVISKEKEVNELLNFFTELYLKLINLYPILIRKLKDKGIPYEEN